MPGAVKNGGRSQRYRSFPSNCGYLRANLITPESPKQLSASRPSLTGHSGKGIKTFITSGLDKNIWTDDCLSANVRMQEAGTLWTNI